VFAPRVDPISGFFEISKPVHVQTVFPEPAIERLDKRILGWMNCNVMFRFFAQKNVALLVNSSPLSQTIVFGSRPSESMKRTILTPEIDVSVG